MRGKQGVARGDDGAARHGAWTGGDAVRANRHAFTLIELLVVITIIMVLVALIYPAATGVVRMALETQCQNHLNELGKITVAYCQAHDGRFPPPGNAMGSACTSAWLYGGTGGRTSWMVDKGIFYRDKLVGDLSVFWCPIHFEEYRFQEVYQIVSATGAKKDIYWTTDDPRQKQRSHIWGSYAMNANVYDKDSESRLSSEFTANHFLFLEEHEKDGKFDDSAMDENDVLADRHEGYGFIACMDGHVIKMTKEDFDATKDGEEKKKYWTPR